MSLLQVYQNKEAPPIPSNVVLSDLAKDFKDRCFAMQVLLYAVLFVVLIDDV
jgi:hypothetical protein